MKEMIILVIACMVIGGCGTGDGGPAGRKFVGKAAAGISEPGCEGCGERGYVNFPAGGKAVELVWPGSDTIEQGSFTRNGREVTITTDDGDVFTFTLSRNGKELVEKNSGTVFVEDGPGT